LKLLTVKSAFDMREPSPKKPVEITWLIMSEVAGCAIAEKVKKHHRYKIHLLKKERKKLI
jgi:hypothetical protein